MAPGVTQAKMMKAGTREVSGEGEQWVNLGGTGGRTG